MNRYEAYVMKHDPVYTVPELRRDMVVCANCAREWVQTCEDSIGWFITSYEHDSVFVLRSEGHLSARYSNMVDCGHEVIRE